MATDVIRYSGDAVDDSTGRSRKWICSRAFIGDAGDARWLSRKSTFVESSYNSSVYSYIVPDTCIYLDYLDENTCTYVFTWLTGCVISHVNWTREGPRAKERTRGSRRSWWKSFLLQAIFFYIFLLLCFFVNQNVPGCCSRQSCLKRVFEDVLSYTFCGYPCEGASPRILKLCGPVLDISTWYSP